MHQRISGLGGGFGRLLALVTIGLIIAGNGAVSAAPPTLPTTADELVAQVQQAIEKGDFPAFERLVYWTDVGRFKKRVIASQIRHSLSRPIQRIQLETADDQTRRDLQSLLNLRLNLPVSDLLRVTFDDGNGEPVAPATVFMVGKLNGAYRIALLVKKKKMLVH